MSALLKPVELAYRGVNRLRRSAYRAGLLSARRLPRPVISIGSITIGGAGKTPATIAVARLLAEASLRCCIVTRGYGRTTRGAAVVDSDAPERFGDEPVLMKRALGDIPIVVGEDRFAAASMFLQRNDCDVFLLDDAMQHLQLHRDCNIALVGAPARWQREGESALRDADVILLRDGASAATDVPCFHVKLETTGVRTGDTLRPLQSLSGRRLFAFAGLADNAQFFRTLQAHGAILTGTRNFRDHHAYTPEEIRSLTEAARSANAELITTAKDAVKIALPLLVLEVELRIERGTDFLQTILMKIGLAK